MTWISGNDTEVGLEWLDRKGDQLGTLGEPGSYSQIVLSPDDRRVAVEIADAGGQFDIWVFDVARGVASRLTTDPANERDPVWSPDSQTLVFSSNESGDQDRHAVPPARGEGACLRQRRRAAQVARRREGALLPVPRWSTDGRGR